MYYYALILDINSYLMISNIKFIFPLIRLVETNLVWPIKIYMLFGGVGGLNPKLACILYRALLQCTTYCHSDFQVKLEKHSMAMIEF